MTAQQLTRLGELLAIEEHRQTVQTLKQAMQQSDFWQDYASSATATKQLARLEQLIDDYDLLCLEPDLPASQVLYQTLYRQTLFQGQYVEANAIVSISAGAGGTEAQDWTAMLYRMYQGFASTQNLTFELLDSSPGETAGLKSVTFLIKGDLAYGYLQAEAGVHRLVRISPFDSDKARHTSFALVEVGPEIPKPELLLKPDEVKIDVYRAGGHGGQSVNTTDSAVRLTHLPTGLVVTMQNERSQLQNKELAFKVLTARLIQRQLEQERLKLRQIKGDHVSAEWGNQIRSYVLHPYQLVKDHRSNFETSDTTGVLNGELLPLIEAYLESQVESTG